MHSISGSANLKNQSNSERIQICSTGTIRKLMCHRKVRGVSLVTGHQEKTPLLILENNCQIRYKLCK